MPTESRSAHPLQGHRGAHPEECTGGISRALLGVMEGEGTLAHSKVTESSRLQTEETRTIREGTTDEPRL